MSDRPIATATAPEHQGVGHIVPLSTLVAVFAALVVLTVLTVGVSYANLGPYSLYAALVIALFKASLVVLYFMHLRWDRPFNLVVFLGCLAFVVLFISLALTDTMTYHSTVIPGQAPAMQKVHTPLGSDTK